MQLSHMTAEEAATLSRLLEQINVPQDSIFKSTNQTNPDDCHITVDCDDDPVLVGIIAQYIKFMGNPNRAMYEALGLYLRRQTERARAVRDTTP